MEEIDGMADLQGEDGKRMETTVSTRWKLNMEISEGGNDKIKQREGK